MTALSSFTLRPGAYRLQDSSSPSEEPVALSALKSHLRISGSAEDADLAVQIKTAREIVEAYSGQALVSRGRLLLLDAWPQKGEMVMNLPAGPVSAVTSIKVYAEDDSFVPLDSGLYRLDTAGCRIHVKSGRADPGRAMDGIEIAMTVGYGTAENVPETFRHAVRLLAAHFYSHRGDAPMTALHQSGALALLAPLRRKGIL